MGSTLVIILIPEIGNSARATVHDNRVIRALHDTRKRNNGARS